MSERIPNPNRRETLLVKNGNTGDIIKSLMTIADMDYQAAQVQDFAQRFKGTDAKDQYAKLKELWKYTRKEIAYEEDPSGKQFIKDPARVFWDNKKGDGTDCKSLSLFEYAVCRSIGVQCYFEFVSFFSKWEDSRQRITHVYPVAIVPGIGEVVLDAVYTKFDERPPGITRLVKKYTKVFKTMADIYHIAGIQKGAMPTAADLQAEATDRAKLVKAPAFVDTSAMSEGEMEVFLLAQRSKMLAEYYTGTPQGAAYEQQYLQRRDALYNGLHRGFNLLGARSRTKAASGWLTLQEKGINLNRGMTLLFDDTEMGAERVGAIPQLNCNALYPIITEASLLAQNVPASLWPGIISAQTDKRYRCQTENIWRTELNKEWPGNGPVLVYEFLTQAMKPANLDLNARDILAGKELRHKDFVQVVNGASKISRANLRTWLENGCIEKSIAGANGKSLGPQLPTDYINAFRQAGQEGIGVFPPLVIAIPVAIGIMILNYKGLKRLADVMGGNATLKQAIQGQVGDITQFVKKYASDVANLAGKEDWQLPGADGGNLPPLPPPGGDNPNNNNMLLIGAALVGGALLLSNNK